MENLNKGMRFRPTDAEGLDFLLRFIARQVMNDSGFITTNVDTYGKQQPWEVYTQGVPCCTDDKDCTDQYRFFITKLKKKKSTSRYSRDVGSNGTWRQQDKGKPMRKDGVGPLLGFRKSMSYVNKGYDRKKKGNWLMKEYELSSAILEKFDDDRRHYVLCALKKRNSKAESALNDVPEETGSNYLGRNLEHETPAFLKFQESEHEAAVESTTSVSNLCRNLEYEIPSFLKFQESAVELTSTSRNLERETPVALKFKESAAESTCSTSYDAGDYNVQSNSVPGLDALQLHQQINTDLEIVGGMFHDMHKDEDLNFVAEPLLAPYTIEATSMFSSDHEYLPELDSWDILLDADDIYQILHGEPEVLQMDQAQQHAEPVNFSSLGSSSDSFCNC